MNRQRILKVLFSALVVFGTCAFYSTLPAYADGTSASSTSTTSASVSVSTGSSSGDGSSTSGNSTNFNIVNTLVRETSGIATVSNSVTQQQISTKIQSAIGNSSVGVTIADWKVSYATTSSSGVCSFTVYYTDSTGTSKAYTYDLNIDKLNTVHSSSSSSSSAISDDSNVVTAVTDGTVTPTIDVASYGTYSSEPAIATSLSLLSTASGQAKHGFWGDYASTGGFSNVTLIERGGVYVGSIINLHAGAFSGDFSLGTTPSTAKYVYQYNEHTGVYSEVTSLFNIKNGKATFVGTEADGYYLFTTENLNLAKQTPIDTTTSLFDSEGFMYMN